MMNIYFGGVMPTEDLKQISLDDIAKEIEMFKIRAGLGDIKIFKNALLPSDTAMVSPELYHRIMKALERMEGIKKEP